MLDQDGLGLLIAIPDEVGLILNQTAGHQHRALLEGDGREFLCAAFNLGLDFRFQVERIADQPILSRRQIVDLRIAAGRHLTI